MLEKRDTAWGGDAKRREVFLSSRVPELTREGFERYFVEHERGDLLPTFWLKAISLFLKHHQNSFMVPFDLVTDFFTIKGLVPTNLPRILDVLHRKGELLQIPDEDSLARVPAILKSCSPGVVSRLVGSCFGKRKIESPILLHYKAYIIFSQEVKEAVAGALEEKPHWEFSELSAQVCDATGKERSAVEPLLVSMIQTGDLRARRVGLKVFVAEIPIEGELLGSIYEEVLNGLEAKLDAEVKGLLREKPGRIHSAQNLKQAQKKTESQRELQQSLIVGQELAARNQLDSLLQVLKKHLADNPTNQLKPNFESLLEELEERVLASQNECSSVKQDIVNMLYDELKVPGVKEKVSTEKE